MSLASRDEADAVFVAKGFPVVEPHASEDPHMENDAIIARHWRVTNRCGVAAACHRGEIAVCNTTDWSSHRLHGTVASLAAPEAEALPAAVGKLQA